MSEIEGVQPVSVLPDRLAVAGFSRPEMSVILGESADRELSRENFNWLGAYMVEEVGLHEIELTDWFRSADGRLDGQRPLDVWGGWDGFEEVFEYARAYKEACDEAMDDEPARPGDELRRTLAIGQSAIQVIERAFALSGVSLEPKQSDRHGPWGDAMIWNPDKPQAPSAHWRRKGVGDDYMIVFKDGEVERRYITFRAEIPGGGTIVMQSAIQEFVGGEQIPTDYDSALDCRPPSAGQVAEFVIPLANEAKNRSLVAYA